MDREKDTIFYAMLARMKYIERWALMRNSTKENISEHSLEVAMIAHALALIGNKRLGKHYDSEHIAMIGVYHDCTEILTGDMPTPIKYHDEQITNAYKQIEQNAAKRLLHMLPQDLREEYVAYFDETAFTQSEKLLVRAADKMSALIKCIEETKAGNHEFYSAKESIAQNIKKLNCQEADIFMKEFLPNYEKTLDELKD